MKEKKYISVPKALTDEDKVFIKLVQEGRIPRSKAFLSAYPNHKNSIFFKESRNSDPETRKRAGSLLVQSSKDKLQAQYISRALTTYQDKMDEFSELSVQGAIDLVQNARSEQVRKDLIIEGIRHKTGTPVQKIAVKEEKTVILTFTEPPKERETIDVNPH